MYKQARHHWQDILLVAVLATVVGYASYQGAQLINPEIILNLRTQDTWFDGDITRVFTDMAIFEADHGRSDVHPLFSLVTMPFVYLVKSARSLEPITAVRIVLAAFTSLWFSLLFILLRLIGCRRFDATLFSLLAAISAASMFWFTIPETYLFGSLSLLMALVLVALAQYFPLSELWYVLVSAMTLGITVTNWMAGILATIVNHRWKQSLLITLKALGLVTVLVILQKLIFPAFNARFLIPSRTVNYELSDGITSAARMPLISIKCLIFDTIVMPAINLAKNSETPEWPFMTVQLSPPGSGNLWAGIAVVLWIALLSLGVWGLFSIKKHLQLRLALGLTLVGQLTLHLLYGDEIFLYSLHFLPLLVVLAALSTLTRARLLALILAGALVLSAGANNSWQFSQATAFTQGYGPLRQIVPTQKLVREG
jgi:hypothetical protein